MAWSEKECRCGRSCPSRSAGNSSVTSGHLGGLARQRNLQLRNPEGGNLVRSFGGIVQNHRQTHAGFGETCLRGLGGISLINVADAKMLLEHALSHVIVIGAALQFHVWFDADFFRERIVYGGLGSVVAFPSPIVGVGACCFPSDALCVGLLVPPGGRTVRIWDFP